MSEARRLGVSPRLRCSSDVNCPDIFELPDGSIAIIGREATEEVRHLLPSDASFGSDERIVVVDRRVMMDARPDIMALR